MISSSSFLDVSTAQLAPDVEHGTRSSKNYVASSRIRIAVDDFGTIVVFQAKLCEAFSSANLKS